MSLEPTTLPSRSTIEPSARPGNTTWPAPVMSERVGEAERHGEDDDGDAAVLSSRMSVELVERPWTTGPRSRAGTKVRRATIRTIATRTTPNVGVSVRSVPRPAGLTRLPASEPATASTASIGRKRPPSIARPPSTSANEMPKAPALVPFGCR